MYVVWLGYESIYMDGYYYTVKASVDLPQPYDPVFGTSQEELASQQRAFKEAVQRFKAQETIAKAMANQQKPAAPVAKKTGHNCRSCNSRNDYAEANQEDGSYLCYECR